MTNENRNYFSIAIGNIRYRALHNTGATATIVGKAVADQLKDRLIPTTANIKQVRNDVLKVIRNLELTFEVDGRSANLVPWGVSDCSYDVILSQDFVRAFQIKCDDETG